MVSVWRCLAFLFTIAMASSEMKSGVKQDMTKKEGGNRKGKLSICTNCNDLSTICFQNFPNDICMGGTKNGTCYTAAECTAKGGVNAASCAQGYGVCCTFSLSCGGTSSQNCTFVESTNVPISGACRNTICPINNNICQLRLDFASFNIAGPSTSSSIETSILNGGIVTALANGQANSFASRCLTDSFSVTNTGGTDPPVICGMNMGQHMYADVDQSNNKGCNDLVFQLGNAGIGTTISTRMWSVKVTQIACDSPVKAPSGCTQYFFNSADTVKTYNFDGGQHLAFQRQTICVRRAKGLCRICWAATAAMDFAVSGSVSVPPVAIKGSGITASTICCGLGTVAGKNKKGYDCLQIPGALNAGIAMVSKAMLKVSRFCGRSFGLVSMVTVVPGTSTGKVKENTSICSTVVPFYVRFISDGTEEAMTIANPKSEALVPNKGFRLAYKQDNMNCL